MTTNTGLTRREMIKGSAAVAAGSTAGTSNLFSWLLSDTTESDIEINVFIGEQMYDTFHNVTPLTPSAYTPAHVTADYLRETVSDFATDLNDLSVSVTVIEEPVPTAEFDTESADAFRESWDDYIENTLADDVVANDSNLLLTEDEPTSLINGNAEIPSCSACDGSNNTAAVVYNVSYPPFVNEENTDMRKKISTDDPIRVVGTAVHEVGHTLGLTHDDALIDEENKEFTIMGAPIDIRGEAHQLMRFNDEIDQSDVRLDLENNSGMFGGFSTFFA